MRGLGSPKRLPTKHLLLVMNSKFVAFSVSYKLSVIYYRVQTKKKQV